MSTLLVLIHILSITISQESYGSSYGRTRTHIPAALCHSPSSEAPSLFPSEKLGNWGEPKSTEEGEITISVQRLEIQTNQKIKLLLLQRASDKSTMQTKILQFQLPH